MAISNTTITPDASSILELRSTSAGFLPPRMTTAERDAIASPASGLVIYNTTTNLLNFYNGSSWQISGGIAGEPVIAPVNTANKYWNGYKNFVTLNSDSLTEGSTNLFYTAARANLKLNISDTASMLSNYRTSYQPIGSYATSAQNDLKVNISDTASMLSNYRTSYQPIGSYATSAQNDLKVNISDTASMLSNYRTSYQPIGNYATSAQNNLKVNISDTASMLANYQSAINTNTSNNALKVNISDTAAMLSPYLKKSLVTAKGDLLVGTSANNVTNLSAGANGTVLTADNTTATGLKWATAQTSTQNIVTLASDVVNNNATANTMQDVTGLSFPVTAGVTYRFKVLIIYSAAVTTTGSRWGISGPASPTLLAYKANWSLSAAAETVANAAAYDLPPATNNTSASATGNICVIEGIIQPSADGTVVVRFASEISGSAITALAGSTLTWW